MKRTVGVLVVLLAAQAWAGKKTVVIAAGDCADPGLVSAAKDFRDAAARELAGSLMEGEVVLDIVRPRPTRSVSDIERQVDSARTLFFGGQVDRAEQLVDRAMEELERASPEAKPWPVTQSALVLKALIAKNADRTREMSEAFRRIVRIDPGFKLDPDAHPPSAIAALDAVKKELARTRKTSVTIRVEAGPVGTVFIDGQAMGASPLKLDLVPGSYRVSIVSGAMVSFPHRLEVPKDTKLNVDLAFEGSLGTQAPLCMTSSVDAPAIKLSQLVAAEQVIVLRNTARRSEPPYITGTLYELSTGKQERAGSVRQELVAALATFVVTGRRVEGIDSTPRPPPLVIVESPKTEAPPPPPPALAKTEPSVKPVQVKPESVKVEPKTDAPRVSEEGRGRLEPSAPPPPPAPLAAASGSTAAERKTALVMIAMGGGLALVGGVLAIAVNAPIDSPGYRVTGLTNQGGPGRVPVAGMNDGARADLVAKLPTVDALNTLSMGLAGAGAGLAVGGLVGLLLFPEPSGPRLSAAASPAGGTVTLSGSF
ncbi:MAG: PEGA domain-containing protein [Myxococcota bacterium]